MGYYARHTLRNLTDCPKCRYGTLEFEAESEERIRLCIDCGQRYEKHGKEWLAMPQASGKPR